MTNKKQQTGLGWGDMTHEVKSLMCKNSLQAIGNVSVTQQKSGQRYEQAIHRKEI